jgi:hypothetical protein
MKILKRFLVFCFIIIISASLIFRCVSVKPSNFYCNNSITPKLPLSLEINLQSFWENIGGNQEEEIEKFLKKNKAEIELWKKMNPGIEPDFNALLKSAPELLKIDNRIYEEIINFVELQINNYMIDPQSKSNGYLECQLVYLTSERGFITWFFYVTSFTSLWTLNLIGYPLARQSTEAKIKLIIKDQNQNEIANYSALGKGSGYTAMYWGYGMYGCVARYSFVPVHRASYLKAIQKSIESLLQQVERDAVILKGKLGV